MGSVSTKRIEHALVNHGDFNPLLVSKFPNFLHCLPFRHAPATVFSLLHKKIWGALRLWLFTCFLRVYDDVAAIVHVVRHDLSFILRQRIQHRSDAVKVHPPVRLQGAKVDTFLVPLCRNAISPCAAFTKSLATFAVISSSATVTGIFPTATVISTPSVSAVAITFIAASVAVAVAVAVTVISTPRVPKTTPRVHATPSPTVSLRRR
uniref:Uncharacterized protein n=1 Tax=Corethron hystrix TaxID=216773 RepID=A0A6U5H2S6_9STRA|mmetsp:Transcript_28555/g.65280  ORF Transcript_28555/g.65280 Transcript_28555/m.65280 type:complete len:207 (+) Transcript_28555:864-1484(+)